MCLCGLYLSFLAKRQKKGNLSDLFIYRKKALIRINIQQQNQDRCLYYLLTLVPTVSSKEKIFFKLKGKFTKTPEEITYKNEQLYFCITLFEAKKKMRKIRYLQYKGLLFYHFVMSYISISVLNFYLCCLLYAV